MVSICQPRGNDPAFGSLWINAAHEVITVQHCPNVCACLAVEIASCCEISCFMALTQTNHAQAFNCKVTHHITTNITVHVLTETVGFFILALLIVFPPASLCVPSLHTPNLDFERGGCWRTRITHDRQTNGLFNEQMPDLGES